MKKTLGQFFANDVVDFARKIHSSVKYKKSLNIVRIASRVSIDRQIEILKDRAYEKICDLKAECYISDEPLTWNDKTNGRHCPNMRIGQQWAVNVFDCAWFYMTAKIDTRYPLDKIVYLINTGGEGLIYTVDGEPKQSITCYASNYDYTLGLPVKRVVDNVCHTHDIAFWIDAGANDLFGNMKNNSIFQEASVAIRHENIRGLAYDMEAIIAVYDMNKNDAEIINIYKEVKRIAKVAKKITDEQAKIERQILAKYLAKENTGDQFTYYAVGHAHLDLAWLWPIRESKRKGARTFVTQMHNISKYPDYIFGASQAQLYEWVKESYPDVYEKVKAIAKTPNWDVQGATWVEMDSNLIGGESMIRQFYYGKQFFRKEFEQDMKIFWVPDSFGYSACIPQVMKLADVPYFLTQKMSWNTVNKFPYHTFKWKGLDGSEVFSHMLPENTYNGPVTAYRMKYGENNYAERKISAESMMLFGIGDGGAGAGYEHLERMTRYKNLDKIPKVVPKKAIDAFKLLDDPNKAYPTHKGELYLEKHQGTYTTQSKNKKYNRKCEFALKNYEILMIKSMEKHIDLPIEREELDTIWKEILLYQFHDILPGSSINRVYEESVARYEILYAKLTKSINLLANKLFGKGVLNLNSFDYKIVSKIGDEWHNIEVPSMSFLPINSITKIDKINVSMTDNSIENELIKVTFAKGVITSLIYKPTNKEFVRGKMAVFAQYRDIGDCWDIAPKNYQGSKIVGKCVEFNVYLDGATAIAQSTFTLKDCKIYNKYILAQGSKMVQMEIKVICKQKSSMLRMEFQTSIMSDIAKFNIQFGHLTRATTERNSIEKAQYEVSGQKFVDMSDKTGGISLINDCKYGFRVKGSTIDINLIRSPKKGPGTDVDQGENTFTLALLPHEGGLDSTTYQASYLINNPLIMTDGDANNEKVTLFSSDNNNIILESVKISDDDKGIIARLYNCSEQAQSATIEYNGYTATSLVGIMENELEQLSENNIKFNAFELKLVKFDKW